MGAWSYRAVRVIVPLSFLMAENGVIRFCVTPFILWASLAQGNVSVWLNEQVRRAVLCDALMAESISQLQIRVRVRRNIREVCVKHSGVPIMARSC